ncbi:class I SAM-dependent methyltransferase [Streptomyces sp. HB2AG]|uniref:class I SAM-dependent methyltransferase n=1 Tax=Streptomyces sp. HB2AG TaxID=2983400 RepID=UPI003FA71B0C
MTTGSFEETVRPADGPPAAAGPAGPGAVDPARWPDVARVPRAVLRGRAARLLVERALARLPLRAVLPDGTVLGAGDPGSPVLEVLRPEAFFRRLGADGLIGFGESWTAREWDAQDPVGVLTVLASGAAELVPAPLQRLRGAWARRQPAAQRNTVANTRGNIHRHYDLSNDLFALFLDETMTYSSAVFPEGPDGRPDASWDGLAAAQRAKVDRLLDAAGVGAGTRLLEIGTGWGELALRAAARGARVTTVTLSQEQLRLASRRVAEAGYEDRVTLLLRDYRQVGGVYDAVVSVEMIEAVGAEFWPVYFGVLERVLAPGGRIALQAITMPHDRMEASRSTWTWIQKYVFPGGLIPSVEALESATRRHTGLRIVRREAFGPHYAETLRLWRERFTGRAEEVGALGLDATFHRMWDFYLAYSEAGFRSGYLDVQQLLLTRNGGGAR